MKVSILSLVFAVISVAKSDSYDDNVVFTVHVSGRSPFIWQSNTDLTTQGCDVKGNFAFVTHGMADSKGFWILKLVDKLKQYRGGCVITVNWEKYSGSFFQPWVQIFIYSNWQKVAEVLSRRLFHLEREGVSPDKILLYGHSFGGRISIHSGFLFGFNRIGQIDACDSVGVGFADYDASHDSKKAAKNVQCIHTSSTVGTTVYNCHQDWLMGKCGNSQPADKSFGWTLRFLGIAEKSSEDESSHTLCNIFYINAFENDFKADNRNNCYGVLGPSELPSNFLMGYHNTSSKVIGKIAAPTSVNFPYNVVD